MCTYTAFTSAAQLSYSGNATLYDYSDTTVYVYSDMTADGKREGQPPSRQMMKKVRKHNFLSWHTLIHISAPVWMPSCLLTTLSSWKVSSPSPSTPIH